MNPALLVLLLLGEAALVLPPRSRCMKKGRLAGKSEGQGLDDRVPYVPSVLSATLNELWFPMVFWRQPPPEPLCL